jgi:hypothetical protein
MWATIKLLIGLKMNRIVKMMSGALRNEGLRSHWKIYKGGGSKKWERRG